MAHPHGRHLPNTAARRHGARTLHHDPGLVFFPGQGLLEVSGHADGPFGHSVMIWIQVPMCTPGTPGWPWPGSRSCGEPAAGPWGLTEMHIEDPGGIRIILAEVPAGHWTAFRSCA